MTTTTKHKPRIEGPNARVTTVKKYGGGLGLMSKLAPELADGRDLGDLRYWLMQAHDATNALGGIAVHQCNGTDTPAHTKRRDKLQAWLVESSAELFREVPAWEFTGDPRGGWARVSVGEVRDVMILLEG